MAKSEQPNLISCPNNCELEKFPLTDMDKHLAECPLELVTCEFADAGCSVKLKRRELIHHMMEKQQEHLISATLMNLKLTKESIAEKDRQLAEKDKQIAELQAQLKALQPSFKESTVVALDRFLGLKPLNFMMERVTVADFRENKGRLWQSNSFLSHIGGCMLVLCAQCAVDHHKQPLMRVYLSGSEVGHIPVLTYSVTLQVLNQSANDNHYTRQFKLVILGRNMDGFTRMARSDKYDYITFDELFRRDKEVQYVMNDCIKFRMWLHLMIENEL